MSVELGLKQRQCINIVFLFLNIIFFNSNCTYLVIKNNLDFCTKYLFTTGCMIFRPQKPFYASYFSVLKTGKSSVPFC